MLLCTRVHEGTCTCVCGGQKSMLSVFLNYSTPHFLRQDLSLNLELRDSGWLPGKQVSGFHLSPSYLIPGFINTHHSTWCFM